MPFHGIFGPSSFADRFGAMQNGMGGLPDWWNALNQQMAPIDLSLLPYAGQSTAFDSDIPMSPRQVQTVSYPRPSEPDPGYYGGSPETNPVLQPYGSPPASVPQRASRPPTTPSAPSLGLGDRLMAGLSGGGASLFGGGGPIGGVLNLLGGLFTGQRTDPQGVAQAEMLRMYKSLQTDFGLSEPQARAVVMNPALGKEVYKTLASPATTTIGNTALQGRPFGGVRPVWREPQKPELVESYDPTTGRMKKDYVQPPEPFGGYGAPGNMVVPRQSPGAPGGGVYSAPSATEKAEGTKTGEVLGDQYKTFINESVAATKRINSLQRMQQLSPNAFEGKAAPAFQAVRSALVSFGLEPGKVPAGEEFAALSNKMILDTMPNGSLGAQISDADRDFVAATAPGLATTKEGRKQLIDMHMVLAKRQQETAKLATEYRRRGGTLDGFDAFLADYAEKNQLFASATPVTATETPSVPKVGEVRTNKHGKKGRWTGKGWEIVD